MRKQLGQEEVEAEKREYLRALETPGTPTSGLPLPISEYHTPDAEANGGAPQFTDDDVVEVGRGLANYNSAQILAVKGLNRYVDFVLHSRLCGWVCSYGVHFCFLVRSCPRFWGTRILNTLLRILRFESLHGMRIVTNVEFLILNSFPRHGFLCSFFSVAARWRVFYLVYIFLVFCGLF